MRNLKAKFAIISILVLMLPATNFAAFQNTQMSSLKLSGKILDNQKANITIYIERDGSWLKVLTIASKTRYALDLLPENNYYVLFENTRGKKKYLHLDAGESGVWKTKMDIDFNNTNDNFAKFYHHPIYKEYVFEIISKREEDSVIIVRPIAPTL